jgi:hypothetical protein
MATFVLSLSLVACSKPSGPTCEQITDHLLEIMKAPGGHEGMGLGVGNRKQMIDSCEKRDPSKEARQCLMAAKDVTQMANCAPAPTKESAKPAP